MKTTEKYGSHESQTGDLYLPKERVNGLVCLFHGGFWKMPYDRFQMNSISEELESSNYAVWNIEYRRVGESDRKWRDTLDDAVLSINYVAELISKYPSINKDKIIVAGHSAGGQIAIWLSAQHLCISPLRFIGLAPILDLENAYKQKEVQKFISDLIGGSPKEYPERYAEYSPYEQIQSASKQTVFHGDTDKDVPKELNRRYLDKTVNKESDFEYIEIEECGHMDFLDISSKAFSRFKRQLIELLSR